MLRTRVMPCLLLQQGALVKTVQFRKPGYIGDPINAVRIYNEKEVDELVFLDISATPAGHGPPLGTLREIAGECFMPLAYGGGVRTIEDIREILRIGIEKVVINTHAVEDPTFIRAAADQFGSQSIVVSMDVRHRLLGGYQVFTRGARQATGLDPVAWADRVQDLGAGEILLTSIDRDGTQSGYDIELLERVCRAVDLPVIASGGAGSLADFAAAVKAGASACAAGSMVVYFGRNRAVLINFPTRSELESVLA
ncbi:MAG TPA: AglZ/HisF2 family acetamidino modification protein [Anaerolineaceae bacterium]|jgi:cyclase|nr:AglZ/HisF2 family acetamidino modification protein [Anaerolineaceae bacterium]